MKHLIDKDKLLEELKKIKQNLSASPIVVIENVESLVESLETKEVDLEKEIDKYFFPISAQDIKEEPFTQMAQCARYFFELGLKQKGK